MTITRAIIAVAGLAFAVALVVAADVRTRHALEVCHDRLEAAATPAEAANVCVARP